MCPQRRPWHWQETECADLIAQSGRASVLAHREQFHQSTMVKISLAAVPLALTLRKIKLGGAAPVGH